MDFFQRPEFSLKLYLAEGYLIGTLIYLHIHPCRIWSCTFRFFFPRRTLLFISSPLKCNCGIRYLDTWYMPSKPISRGHDTGTQCCTDTCMIIPLYQRVLLAFLLFQYKKMTEKARSSHNFIRWMIILYIKILLWNMTRHVIGIIAASISMSWIWISAELHLHTPYPCPYSHTETS